MGLRQKTLLLSIVALIGCGSQAGVYEPAPQPSTGQTRAKAPAFVLRDLNGGAVSLERLKGKAVFLDFWATWCPPCVMSAPDVEKMVGEYKGKNIEFVSVSLDQNEEAVRRFVSRHALSSKVAMAGDSNIEARYGVSGIPAFFLIDKKGFAVKMWEGYHPSYAKAWREAINGLLKP